MPVAQDVDLRGEVMRRSFGRYQVLRMNELYWQQLGERYSRRVRWLQISSAVAASATVVGILTQSGATWLLAVLALLAVVASAVSPVLNYERKAAVCETMRIGDALLLARTEALLRDLKRAPIDESHLAREEELTLLEAGFAALDHGPADYKLLSWTWDRVTNEEFPADRAWEYF